MAEIGQDPFEAVARKDLRHLSSICDSNGFYSLVSDDGNTLLHAAALTGDKNVVKFLVEGADFPVDVQNSYGQTPLQLCVSQGNVECVLYLLQKGADKSLSNNFGANSLHLGLSNKSYEVSKILLQHSSRNDVQIRNGEGESLIALACESGSLALVQLITSFVGFIAVKEDKHPENLKSPLHYAVQGGKADVVRFLVEEAGCAAGAADGAGDAPLHYACDAGDPEMVRALLEGVRGRGELAALLGARDGAGDTPLEVALQQGREEVVTWLRGLLAAQVEGMGAAVTTGDWRRPQQQAGEVEL